MTKDDKKYESVGNIRIKQPKAKKKKNKKSDSTPLGIKILVWFMFIAMCLSFIAALIYMFTSALG